MRAIASPSYLAVLTGPAAAAQDGRRSPIVRVRLRDDATVQGFLRGNSADELVVFTGDGQYRHVPLADVQRLEVRQRTGTHVKRGAVMGVFLWASLMFAASIDRLEDAGAGRGSRGRSWPAASAWGRSSGKSVPRYGWVPTEPGRLTGALDPPPARVSLRF